MSLNWTLRLLLPALLLWPTVGSIVASRTQGDGAPAAASCRCQPDRCSCDHEASDPDVCDEPGGSCSLRAAPCHAVPATATSPISLGPFTIVAAPGTVPPLPPAAASTLVFHPTATGSLPVPDHPPETLRS